ncbi:hypothetical protein NDU88_001357 [Pleurodeles waltl]|uniref:Uncharacterized protein n=1 Tax=Pleurodeles waltl TaxID=8319 RepID=A0AAV7NEX7_PLEWA|nr:hypothetical protein NDU88_001357 [Pleurodeles waltl]
MLQAGGRQWNQQALLKDPYGALPGRSSSVVQASRHRWTGLQVAGSKPLGRGWGSSASGYSGCHGEMALRCYHEAQKRKQQDCCVSVRR